MSLYSRTATELSQQLARRECSSREIVEALIARREELGTGVPAFVLGLDAEARAAADDADRRLASGERSPLMGLPISVKENIDVAGTASTLGLSARRDHRADTDAAVVRCLREAGAVVLGKTNVPQSLLSVETTNFLFGTTPNPWSRERAPGGSSGGEAAALASGQSVLGIGTDIGGSLRIPAAFCGVAALKPTEHRWSNLGSRTAIAGQESIRSQIGPMARTSADVALLFEALESSRFAAQDPFVPPVRNPSAAGVDVSKLRVGFWESDGLLTPAASVMRGVRAAAKHLADDGADVVEVDPENARRLTWLFFAILSADGGRTLDAALQGERVIPPLRRIKRLASLPNRARRALALAMLVLGEERSAYLLDALGEKSVGQLWRLTSERGALRQRELEFFERHRLDVVVCPAFATPALQHGSSADFSVGACYSMRYNVLNFPAGVVPVTRVRTNETERSELRDRLDRTARSIEQGSAGLPVGVQVVGRPHCEHHVLAAMLAIEARARTGQDFPETPCP